MLKARAPRFFRHSTVRSVPVHRPSSRLGGHQAMKERGEGGLGPAAIAHLRELHKPLHDMERMFATDPRPRAAAIDAPPASPFLPLRGYNAKARQVRLTAVLPNRPSSPCCGGSHSARRPLVR